MQAPRFLGIILYLIDLQLYIINRPCLIFMRRLSSSEETVNTNNMSSQEETALSGDDRVTDNAIIDVSNETIANTTDNAGDEPQALTYMKQSDLVMFPPSDEVLSHRTCNDPLSDPLAIDEVHSGNEDMPFDRNPLELIEAELPTETDANADILLVNVDSLHNSSPIREREDDNPFEEIPQEPCATEAEEGVRSDGSDSGLGSEPSHNVLMVPTKPSVCKFNLNNSN